ncbi:hypothetical protein [Bradyrhizobium sp. AZCC 2289]|uniref:hypothetical protein n=1 Tax=Bradyrhizobium sp. AZCC 2289 TaxID=3117026 RepID=UPI002FF08A27
MKLPERFARRKGRGFHSAIATSFAVEFEAAEEVMLPQIMASGATNILLIADARMTAISLSDGSSLPKQLGRDYVLYGPPASSGLFHPKIVLQLGRDGGRAFINSANLTAAGLSGNVEVATEIECSNETGPEQDFIHSVWRYLEHVTAEAQGAARDALLWARERTPWLMENVPDTVQTLADGSAIAFLAAPSDSGILERYAGLVNAAPVERLIIVSPYWDDALQSVADLRTALAPKRITILLDTHRHDFPRVVDIPSEVELIDIGDWSKSRFTHAKLFIALTFEHEHVLSGSANCTPAALGRAGFQGTNAEACVYRKLPTGTSIEALGLSELLSRLPTLPNELPPIKHRDPIPLGPIANRYPGVFEVDHDFLLWTRPATPDWSGYNIQLLDRDGNVLHVSGPEKHDPRGDRYAVLCDTDILAQVHFARAAAGDFSSTIAPVTHRALVKARRREPTTGRVARSASLFDDGTGIELFLLEAFEDLFRADTGEDDVRTELHSSRDGRTRTEVEQKPSRILSYEEFMREREGRPVSGRRGENALAGTHCDGVRALLNRLSGIVDKEQKSAGEENDDWMDLGDETESTDGPEGNETPAPNPLPPEAPQQKPADRKAFERAVTKYAEGLTKIARPVGAADVVKLRLLLMAILWNAQCGAFPGGLTCTIDEQGWPRLAVRAISAFFWGKHPPVRRLVLEGDFQEMPIDFLECWTTTIWTLDAIIVALFKNPNHREFISRLPQLRTHIIRQLGLRDTELAGEAMTKRKLQLDQRMGSRLGFEWLQNVS